MCPDSLSILERVCPLAAPRGRWRCPEATLALALPLMQRQCGRDAAGGATMHTALPAGQRQRVRSCAMWAALLPEPPDRSAAGSAAVASWQRRYHRCEAGASGLAAVLPAGIAVSGGGGPLHCDRAGAVRCCTTTLRAATSTSGWRARSSWCGTSANERQSRELCCAGGE